MNRVTNVHPLIIISNVETIVIAWVFFVYRENALIACKEKVVDDFNQLFLKCPILITIIKNMAYYMFMMFKSYTMLNSLRDG